MPTPCIVGSDDDVVLKFSEAALANPPVKVVSGLAGALVSSTA
jgi:hypothetical protein